MTFLKWLSIAAIIVAGYLIPYVHSKMNPGWADKLGAMWFVYQGFWSLLIALPVLYIAPLKVGAAVALIEFSAIVLNYLALQNFLGVNTLDWAFDYYGQVITALAVLEAFVLAWSMPSVSLRPLYSCFKSCISGLSSCYSFVSSFKEVLK